jgi:hypothetical protein
MVDSDLLWWLPQDFLLRTLSSHNAQNHPAAASDLAKCKQRTTAARVHFLVSISVLLRFCHALFANALVEHLLHAQLRPSRTLMQLSGYDTSRPTARALNMHSKNVIPCGVKSCSIQ